MTTEVGSARHRFCGMALCLIVSVSAVAAPANTVLRHVEREYFDWSTQHDSISYPPLDTMARLSAMSALPDLSLAQSRRSAQRARAWLDRLAAIDATALDHDDQVSLEALQWILNRYAEAPAYYWLDFPITVYGTRLAPVHDVFTGYVFRGPADGGRYVALLGQYPALIDGMTAKLRGQLARRIVMPAAELVIARRFVASLLTTPEASLWSVAPDRLAALPPAARERIRAQVRTVIEARIQPSLRRLLTFLDGAYKDRAPATVGLSQYPGGLAYYRWLVRFHTTEDVSPQDVQARGLAEVARLEALLTLIGEALGVPGGLPAMRERVRTDRRFYARTPEELGERLNSALRRIEPIIGQAFSRPPSAPYVVRRLRPELEGGLTFGYYQDPTPANPAGVYWFNGSALDQRPILSVAALIYHELVPGHHMQHSYQVGNARLPDFRRFGGSNAFDEGWATYASSVAGDLGMYADPYDHWGFLANELMVATRLVVDPGMNALGWSRERAAAYLAEHTFMSPQQIETETLRYSADIPAQGLAYGMVSGKLREIREREQGALGPRFDLRRFHDAVLLSGALPMGVLERHVAWYLRSGPGSTVAPAPVPTEGTAP